MRRERDRQSHSIGESPSMAQIQNKQNRDQQYLAVRVGRGPQPLAVDTDTYKTESADYIEDICPYATFQLSKPTYSESSYSGNVYSGPYHSVRGSFVYHDVKPPPIDKFKLGHVSFFSTLFFCYCRPHLSILFSSTVSTNRISSVTNIIFLFRAKNQNTPKLGGKVEDSGIPIQKVKVITDQGRRRRFMKQIFLEVISKLNSRIYKEICDSTAYKLYANSITIVLYTAGFDVRRKV